MMAERISKGTTTIGDNMMAHYLYEMAEHAGTIFKQYPDRFKKLDLKLYDPTNALIAHASLVASNITGEHMLSPPPDNPKTFFPDVKIT
ncbi:MAG: hypothetical protein LUQ22_07390 [Methanotrichaceae archaeon]|nr:hypothetical protein [Methanotrichaceae archaeon]